MNAQLKKAEIFQSLHDRAGVFAIPNPWDAGSAKILASLGFEALATTSAGFAYSVGKPDGEGAVDRDETLANARAIVEATSLPVSADLENGFGDTPQACAETIRLAAGVGLVGGSLEDLAAIGARRVSVGSVLARTAYGAFLRAAKEIRNTGTFKFADQTAPYRELNTLFRNQPNP